MVAQSPGKYWKYACTPYLSLYLITVIHMWGERWLLIVFHYREHTASMEDFLMGSGTTRTPRFGSYFFFRVNLTIHYASIWFEFFFYLAHRLVLPVLHLGVRELSNWSCGKEINYNVECIKHDPSVEGSAQDSHCHQWIFCGVYKKYISLKKIPCWRTALLLPRREKGENIFIVLEKAVSCGCSLTLNL